jgi:dolichyl-phosphate-mannose--protein O-mannosyl transferase
MRGFMALFGLALVPCAYLTMRYSGMTTETSLLASVFVLFGNNSLYIFHKTLYLCII